MTPAETTAELRISNLSASYNKTIVLNDISLALSPGEFVCLCGPNGAGKTTLLSVMAGVPDARLKVQGDAGEISKLPRRDAARILAYLQQSEYSEWDFTVSDYVLQGRYAYTKFGHYTAEDHAVVEKLLTDLGLTQFANRTINSLSGG